MTAYYNEFDPNAAQWLRNLIAAGHLPTGDVDERSIEDVRPDELAGYVQCHFFAGIGGWPLALAIAGWPADRPVWTGSCPCQPFSAAGKGDGFADERHLWPAWQHLIAQCRPSVVFGEQVASAAVGPWVDLVQADLEGMGYAFGCVPFPAASVGAPHIRDRTYWVGDAHDARLEGRRVSAERPVELLTGAGGVAGGLADADILAGGQGRALDGGRHSGSDAEPRAGLGGGVALGGSRPGPTNGQWADADWLLCTDGKWRPVVATHVALVDGISDTMECVRAGHETEEKVSIYAASNHSYPRQILSSLRGSTESKNDQREAGGSRRIFAQDLLRPAVHGAGNGQGELHKLEPYADESAPASEAVVPSVRRNREAPRPSPGREPFQQFTVELDDIVSLLPPSLALAANNGRWRDVEALHSLCKAICEAGSVQYAPEQAQAVWASLGEEAKDCIRLGVDVRAWRKLVFQPLSTGGHGRVVRLRAYGNAIVPQQAAEFIQAYAEARGLILADTELAA